MRGGARRLLLGLALTLVAGPSWADRAEEPTAEATTPRDFWLELIDRHGPRARRLAQLAERALAATTSLHQADADPFGSQQARLGREALELARAGAALRPRDPELLLMVARAAARQAPAEAEAALTTYFAVTGAGTNADPGATIRTGEPVAAAFELRGMLAVRTGRVDAGIADLQRGDGGLPGATIALASALAQRGQLDQAIALLAAPRRVVGPYSADAVRAALALAVAYDRDEQIGAAFAVLAELERTLGSNLLSMAQGAIDEAWFVQPGERAYYLALLYEVTGFLPEARAMWLHYAAGERAAFTRRAQAHVDAIDRLRRRGQP